MSVDEQQELQKRIEAKARQEKEKNSKAKRKGNKTLVGQHHL